jgi:CheY-like chemotaxis protein
MNDASTYHWDSKSILVVEDDESSAYLLGEILRGTGASIDFSTDGKEAVEYIRQNPETDLILMDIHLPEKDGFTATREIKALTKNIVVIAQTAYAFSVDEHEAIKAGCDGFLTKPLSAAVLLNKLDSFLA